MLDLDTIRTPEQRAARAKMGNSMKALPCVMCGKEAGKAAAHVHLHYGGDTVILPEEEAKAAAECPGGDLGTYPVGPRCARHPALRPYLI